jgi:hypothetical protein
MPDPGIPIDCPVRGQPLMYQWTEEHDGKDTHGYVCIRDGILRLTPRGLQWRPPLRSRPA